MPRMGGKEAYREMRRIREDAQVILVSGYSEQQVRERFGNVGFAGFLKKPVQSKRLLDMMRDVLKV